MASLSSQKRDLLPAEEANVGKEAQEKGSQGTIQVTSSW